MPATKRSQQQATADARHAVRVSLKLNKATDADILSWLDDQQEDGTGKQAAIKDAIRYFIWAAKTGQPKY